MTGDVKRRLRKIQKIIVGLDPKQNGKEVYYQIMNYKKKILITKKKATENEEWKSHFFQENPNLSNLWENGVQKQWDYVACLMKKGNINVLENDKKRCIKIKNKHLMRCPRTNIYNDSKKTSRTRNGTQHTYRKKNNNRIP